VRQAEFGGMRIGDNDSDKHKRSRTYRNTATTGPCCSDDSISHANHVLLMTDTTTEALQLPLSHVCFTHIRFLSEYSGENFGPANLIIMIV
jgi:hypothetical protein